MKEQIKELRVKIDGLAQLVKGLGPHKDNINWRAFHSRETEQAYDSLLLAKAWLGKVLGELGEVTPYTNDGKRKTVKDIEPTDAKSSGQGLFKDDFELLWWSQELNHIEKVDWLRQEISNVFKEWRSLEITGLNWTTVVSFEQHIQEARFWLGFELERIRESSNSNI